MILGEDVDWQLELTLRNYTYFWALNDSMYELIPKRAERTDAPSMTLPAMRDPREDLRKTETFDKSDSRDIFI